MRWLIDEVFRPAVDIAHFLADAGWNPGDVLSAQEYHDACGRLKAGLNRANTVRQNLPMGDVPVAVQNLEMAVRDFGTMTDPATAEAVGQSLYISARLGWVALLNHLPPGSPAPPPAIYPSRRRETTPWAALDAEGRVETPDTEVRKEASRSQMIEHLKTLTDGVLDRKIAGADLFNLHSQIYHMLQELSPDQFEESMRTDFTLARAAFEHLSKPNRHETITSTMVYKAAERLRPVLNYFLSPKPSAQLAGATAGTLDMGIPEARIEILEQEHQSGLYGKVFKGRQTDLGRIVAVKIIRPDWPNAADAIEHAKAIARAGTHANIVTVYCVEHIRVPGVDEPQSAMIMEWLEGQNLGDRLGGPEFSGEEVRQICMGLLDGVQHMHANDIAHGDLHAGNVILTGGTIPKIIDIDPNKDITLARLSIISRQAAVQSDIEYCRGLVLHVFSHGPVSIATRNRLDVELRQAKSIDDLRGVVDHGLQGESEIAQHQPRIDDGTAAVRRFDQIRQSFESVVSESSFHDLISDRAVLAVCIVPDIVYRLDRQSIHGTLPPPAHENLDCQWDTDRYTEISAAECGPWKSVLDVDSQGVIRAASTLAIRGSVNDRLARDFLGEHRAEHLIRSTHLQHTLVYSLRLWAAVLRQWKVAGPLRLGISLLAVQGSDLLLYDRELCDRPQKQPVLSADMITISSLADFDDAQMVFQILKPAFDDIARGFGLREWPLGSFGIS